MHDDICHARIFSFDNFFVEVSSDCSWNCDPSVYWLLSQVCGETEVIGVITLTLPLQ